MCLFSGSGVFLFTPVNFYLNVTATRFGLPLAVAKGYIKKSEWTDWKFKLFIGMFIHSSSCCVVFFTASACVISSMTLSDHSFVSPCLLILLDLRVSTCIFYCMGQCANVPRLLQHALMVIKVDCVLRHMCNAVRVRVRGYLPWHAGMVPLQVPLLVQVLVTDLSPPIIT